MRLKSLKAQKDKNVELEQVLAESAQARKEHREAREQLKKVLAQAEAMLSSHGGRMAH